MDNYICSPENCKLPFGKHTQADHHRLFSDVRRRAKTRAIAQNPLSEGSIAVILPTKESLCRPKRSAPGCVAWVRLRRTCRDQGRKLWADFLQWTSSGFPRNHWTLEPLEIKSTIVLDGSLAQATSNLWRQEDINSHSRERSFQDQLPTSTKKDYKERMK